MTLSVRLVSGVPSSVIKALVRFSAMFGWLLKAENCTSAFITLLSTPESNGAKVLAGFFFPKLLFPALKPLACADVLLSELGERHRLWALLLHGGLSRSHHVVGLQHAHVPGGLKRTWD